MRILVTGSAGFIGFHLAQRLLEKGIEVVGLDNLEDSYELGLKQGRLAKTGIESRDADYGRMVGSAIFSNYRFIRLDLTDFEALQKLCASERFSIVCNLAARAGVQASFDDPFRCINSNVVGLVTLLEACRRSGIDRILHASSSSVYGASADIPYRVDDRADRPLSIYGASKRADELLCYPYCHKYNLSIALMRFFTVYGPWGRPDMAPFIFLRALLNDQPIRLNNSGDMSRDFTFVDDIIDAILRVIDGLLGRSHTAGYRIYNAGRGSPVPLLDFVAALEKASGISARIEQRPLPAGDMRDTWADIQQGDPIPEWSPQVNIEEGISRFVAWYRIYYADHHQ